MLRISIALAILLAATTAHAGLVCEDVDGQVKQLEAAARNPAKLRELDELWFYCTQGQAKYKARVVKACTAIASRVDVAKKPADDEGNLVFKQMSCVRALAEHGVNPVKTKTKDVDYIGDQLAGKFLMQDDPSDTFRTLELSRDARVLPKVLEIYKAHLATAAKTPPRGWREQNWVRWHRAALSVIGTLGTEAELAFLDEVRAGSKDRRVHAWVDAAKKSIERR